MWESVLGCGKRYERRCRKVCWGVGETRGDVGKGEVREVKWGSVLGPHAVTHFPTPPPTHQHTSPLTPIHSPTPLPTLLHSPLFFLFQLTSPHITTHFPTPPPYLFPQLPSPPPIPQCTSPLTPCTLPHLYVF